MGRDIECINLVDLHDIHLNLKVCNQAKMILLLDRTLHISPLVIMYKPKPVVLYLS
jgi:hypothetical protein